MIIRKRSSIIIAVFIFFAGFLVLPDNSEAQQTPQCDLSSIVFSPSGNQRSDWFRKRNRPNFSVILTGNGNCGGKVLQEVTLVNTQGLNNDIEALNDQPVTFDRGSNRIVFTFIAGEEACSSDFGKDCQLEFFARSEGSPDGFWSTETGNRGNLNYECEGDFFCDGDITFELLRTQDGRIGNFPSSPADSICAFIAPDNRFQCINNSNQRASQNQCNQVNECRGRNCLVIDSSLCGQDAGTGGRPQPPGPGRPATVSFEIPNPVQAESLVDLAKAIGRFLLQIAIPIAVIIIIYAGILFLISQGDKDKIIKARKALLYAAIGLAIILIGQGFVTLVQSILNLGTP